MSQAPCLWVRMALCRNSCVGIIQSKWNILDLCVSWNLEMPAHVPSRSHLPTCWYAKCLVHLSHSEHAVVCRSHWEKEMYSSSAGWMWVLQRRSLAPPSSSQGYFSFWHRKGWTLWFLELFMAWLLRNSKINSSMKRKSRLSHTKTFFTIYYHKDMYKVT